MPLFLQLELDLFCSSITFIIPVLQVVKGFLFYTLK